MVTFFEANYQRSIEHQSESSRSSLENANKYFGYIDLDRWQYAAIEVNFTDILSAGTSLGFDVKYPFGQGGAFSRAYHTGPMLNLNGTYIKNQLFVIPQYASIGPANPGTSDETMQLYYRYSDVKGDDSYFCYKSLGPLKDYRAERLNDLELLVSGRSPQYDNFDRIRVDGNKTLAKWLQNAAQDLSNIQRTAVPTAENMLPAQISYSFALEAKASIDAKYTLVANAFNPLVPGVSAGADNTNKFTLYFNAVKSKAAAAAKVGQAAIKKKERKLVPQTIGVVSELD